jgi:peptidoglycan hydrolase CwlO-like protein
MSTLIILAIQTKGAAILIILALLLGAAIIGYLSAWFYSKSIYVKKIDIIQAEKDELERQIAGLNEEIGKLQENLAEKDKEIENLTKGKKS